VSVECNGRAAFGGFTAQLYLKTFVKCSCLIFGLDFGTIYLRRPLVCRRVAVHSEKAGVAAHFGVWGGKKMQTNLKIFWEVDLTFAIT
jgi:hypothetical protein